LELFGFAGWEKGMLLDCGWMERKRYEIAGCIYGRSEEYGFDIIIEERTIILSSYSVKRHAREVSEKVNRCGSIMTTTISQTPQYQHQVLQNSISHLFRTGCENGMQK
jgi:hypothetical protein